MQENILFFQNRLKIYRGGKKITRKDVREIFIKLYTTFLDSCCCQYSTVFYSFSRRTGRISYFLSSSHVSNSKLPTHFKSFSLVVPSLHVSDSRQKKTTKKKPHKPKPNCKRLGNLPEVTPIQCSKAHLSISHLSAQ